MTGIVQAILGMTFTVAATPAAFTNDANTLLLLHMDGTDATTTFYDDTGGTAGQTAVIFDGSGDYYSSTVTTSATDSKYCLVACTFYFNRSIPSSGQQVIASIYLPGGNGFYIWVNGGRMQIEGGNGTIYENSENSLRGNDWNQVVLYIDATSSGNNRIFVNGVSNAITSSVSNSNFNWGATNAVVKVGQQNSNLSGTGSDWDGKIAQLYIHNAAGVPTISNFWDAGSSKPRDLGTNGTATGLAQPLIYHYGGTSTFTTNNGTGFASYTLTANGNVATSTGPVYAIRTGKVLTANGNAQIDTATKKFGTAAALFDGNGDYLTMGTQSDLNFGTGDFTIEAWVYFDQLSTTNRHTLISNGVTSFTTNWIKFSAADLGSDYYPQVTAYNYSSGGAPLMTSSTAVTNGQWYHIAYVRSSTNHYLYLNGTQVASNTSGTAQGISVNFNANNITNIGRYSFDNGSNPSSTYFDGWIDELRISNIARYTGNFTPGV